MANDLEKRSNGPQSETEGPLHNLRELIQGARQNVLRSVDAVQVQTCWEIGRHIVEFEQGGAARAETLDLKAGEMNHQVLAKWTCTSA